MHYDPDRQYDLHPPIYSNQYPVPQPFIATPIPEEPGFVPSNHPPSFAAAEVNNITLTKSSRFPLPDPDSGSDDVCPSILVFMAGWFFIWIWFGGFAYIRSRNAYARLFAKLSIGMFVSAYIAFWIAVSVVIFQHRK